MSIELVTVDAFTEVAFRGNPAAVCRLDEPAEASWMQAVAAELNLSETAFLSPADDAWSLRWFTPTVEVPLCGHATLASAHVLFADGIASPDDVIRFQTASGELSATLRGDGRVELDFPARPARPGAVPPSLGPALALPDDDVVATGLSSVDAGEPGILVEVTSPDLVRQLRPDFGALVELPADLVMVTAAGDGSPFDVVSRCFAPSVGITEDPVTGAAHCTIGPWWADRLGPTLQCHQASRRGGEVAVTVSGDRVGLAGYAVTVLRAELVAS